MNLKELEQAFKGVDLEPLQLKSGEYIKEPLKFLDSHLSTLKNNPGNRNYKPHYDRLLLYYNLLKTKQDEAN